MTLKDREILDETRITEIERGLTQTLKGGEQSNLLIDFSQVRFMSSAFLGLLVKIHKRVRENGGELTLRNVDPKIYRVFEITRLNKVFTID